MPTVTENGNLDNSPGGEDPRGMIMRRVCGKRSPVFFAAEICRVDNVDSPDGEITEIGEACIGASLFIYAGDAAIEVFNGYIQNKEQMAEFAAVFEDLQKNIAETVDFTRKLWRDKEMEDLLG